MITQGKYRLMMALVVAWLGFTIVAFWWFQFKDIQQFSTLNTEQTTFFQASDLEQQMSELLGTNEAPGAITVVHFWDPGCQCSRFNTQHVADLVSEYSNKGVQFVIVPAVTDYDSQQALDLFGTNVKLARMNNIEMPSSPAAAVLDKDGRLAYLGPYSSSANCGDKAGAYVENVLDKILAGNNPQYLNMAAVGCFCNWKNRG